MSSYNKAAQKFLLTLFSLILKSTCIIDYTFLPC